MGVETGLFKKKIQSSIIFQKSLPFGKCLPSGCVQEDNCSDSLLSQTPARSVTVGIWCKNEAWGDELLPARSLLSLAPGVQYVALGLCLHHTTSHHNTIMTSSRTVLRPGTQKWIKPRLKNWPPVYWTSPKTWEGSSPQKVCTYVQGWGHSHFSSNTPPLH